MQRKIESHEKNVKQLPHPHVLSQSYKRAKLVNSRPVKLFCVVTVSFNTRIIYPIIELKMNNIICGLQQDFYNIIKRVFFFFYSNILQSKLDQILKFCKKSKRGSTIMDQLTLILKLITQNWFYRTYNFYVVSVRRR